MCVKLCLRDAAGDERGGARCRRWPHGGGQASAEGTRGPARSPEGHGRGHKVLRITRVPARKTRYHCRGQVSPISDERRRYWGRPLTSSYAARRLASCRRGSHSYAPCAPTAALPARGASAALMPSSLQHKVRLVSSGRAYSCTQQLQQDFPTWPTLRRAACLTDRGGVARHTGSDPLS